MRIGIDLSCLDAGPRTGIGQYAWHLAEEFRKLKTGHEIREMRDIGGIWGKRIPFWSRHVAFAREIEKARLDVFHGTANTLPLTLALSRKGRGVKCVVTIHDLAIYKHPEWFPRGQWFATKFAVPRSIKRADRIIVPSQTTAADVAELFRVPREKIAVVPEGVDDAFFVGRERGAYRQTSDVLREPPRAAPPYNARRYILFVGTLEPRKNIQGLLAAYRLLPGAIRAEYELWVAGKGEIREIGGIREIRGLRVLGYVPDEDMPGLYQNAAVFVYPSFYEGFGLPVLEAMAGGRPVVTSRGTAMEEVAAGVAELVDPHDPDSMATAIAKYLSPGGYAGSLPSSGESHKVASPSRDGANVSQKVERGIRKAREYSWERTARKTLKVYEQISNYSNYSN